MRTHRTGERGDVLMEYVLLMVLIVVPVVCGAKWMYNAGGKSETTASVGMALENQDDFGIVGNRFVEMFRRTFCGLALPVP